jgi:hypothetical protein
MPHGRGLCAAGHRDQCLGSSENPAWTESLITA